MFPGFSPAALKFLSSLARNNRREWFQPRKETFETTLRTPMLQLTEAINAELLKFAPQHIHDPKKAVYRIYRDTRFSPDKTPYKTHLGAIFPGRGSAREATPLSMAGFYVQVSPKSLGIAAGAYQPGPKELYAIRSWLTDNHEAFRKAARKPEKLLGKLHGDSLTRSPKGFNPLHPAADLVRMKSWLYWIELDAEWIVSPKLFGEVIKRFRAAAPVVEMLNAPLLKS